MTERASAAVSVEQPSARRGAVVSVDATLLAELAVALADFGPPLEMRPPLDAVAAMQAAFVVVDDDCSAHVGPLLDRWEKLDESERPPLVIVTRPETSEAAAERYARCDAVLARSAGPEFVKRTVLAALEIRKLHEDFDELGRFAALGRALAGVLHELKNPLANVLGAVDRIAGLAEDDARLAPWSRIAKRNGDLLRESLMDLLDGLRADVAFAPVALHGVLERAAMYAIGGDINVRGRIAVERRWCQPAPVVQGSSGQLLHLFLNLVVNARQAVGETGVVSMTTEWTAADRVAVEVRDSGPGIPAELLPTLFRARRTTKARGTGIGLVFCKEIVDKHGGDIAACNAPTGGACFRIELAAAAG